METKKVAFADANVLRILIERNIKFLDLKKTPLPPPVFGCAFIPDLTPESIETAGAEAMRRQDHSGMGTLTAELIDDIG